jgi:hypothetical protein
VTITLKNKSSNALERERKEAMSQTMKTRLSGLVPLLSIANAPATTFPGRRSIHASAARAASLGIDRKAVLQKDLMKGPSFGDFIASGHELTPEEALELKEEDDATESKAKANKLAARKKQ